MEETVRLYYITRDYCAILRDIWHNNDGMRQVWLFDIKFRDKAIKY